MTVSWRQPRPLIAPPLCLNPSLRAALLPAGHGRMPTHMWRVDEEGDDRQLEDRAHEGVVVDGVAEDRDAAGAADERHLQVG